MKTLNTVEELQHELKQANEVIEDLLGIVVANRKVLENCKFKLKHPTNYYPLNGRFVAGDNYFVRAEAAWKLLRGRLKDTTRWEVKALKDEIGNKMSKIVSLGGTPNPELRDRWDALSKIEYEIADSDEINTELY